MLVVAPAYYRKNEWMSLGALQFYRYIISYLVSEGNCWVLLNTTRGLKADVRSLTVVASTPGYSCRILHVEYVRA